MGDDMLHLDCNRLMVLEPTETILRFQGIALRIFRGIQRCGRQVPPWRQS